MVVHDQHSMRLLLHVQLGHIQMAVLALPDLPLSYIPRTPGCPQSAPARDQPYNETVKSPSF
jgi:hypothetical protein